MKTYTNGKVTVKEAKEIKDCKGCYFAKDCFKREGFGIKSCTYPKAVIFVEVKE